MDEQTRRAMYATKVKAHYHNLTNANLVKTLATLDGDTTRFLTDLVNRAYHEDKPAIEVAEAVKFYTHDMAAI